MKNEQPQLKWPTNKELISVLRHHIECATDDQAKSALAELEIIEKNLLVKRQNQQSQYVPFPKIFKDFREQLQRTEQQRELDRLLSDFIDFLSDHYGGVSTRIPIKRTLHMKLVQAGCDLWDDSIAS